MLEVIETLVSIIFVFCMKFFFFSSNSWGHKTGIYTQLQSDNDGHTKTGYDVKASLVINNSLEPMEVQESDSTNILFPKSILVQ